MLAQLVITSARSYELSH